MIWFGACRYVQWHYNIWTIERVRAHAVIEAALTCTEEVPMQEKPFYQSKKFVYALAFVMATAVMALLPSLLAWLDVQVDPATVEMIEESLPRLFAVALFVIGGHALNDAISLSRGYQPPQFDAVAAPRAPTNANASVPAASYGVPEPDTGATRVPPPQETIPKETPNEAAH